MDFVKYLNSGRTPSFFPGLRLGGWDRLAPWAILASEDHDEDEEGLVVDAQLSKTYLLCELLPFTLVWAIESKEDGK